MGRRGKGVSRALLSRLERLGVCPKDEAGRYAVELRKLADRSLDSKSAEKAAKIFKALSDPTRLRMLKLLKNKPMCVCEIMVALNLSQPTTSYHLNVLKSAGILSKSRKGRWIFYQLAMKEPLKFLDRVAKA